MSVLTFLYALAIAPLRGGMEIVLDVAYGLTGSWGWSIVLLSIAVNVALIPVYHLAESWQEDERSLQKKMAGKLAEVKAVYSGRERYMFTRAVYRMYGYHPLMALRTSLGLLIQIPFFFAAYNLLHSNPALNGVSFFFIPNLGQPDALIQLVGHSLNLLPFVMTGVNLLSATVYSARLSGRDKVQLYVLAALFLLLLYSAAAGLLLYWTCNNIFSFFKNLVYSRYVYADSRHEPPGWLLALRRALAVPGWLTGRAGARLPSWSDLLPAAGALILFVLAEVVWRKKFVVEAVLFSSLLIWLACALRMGSLRRAGNILLRHSGWLFLLLALFVGLLLPLSFSAAKYATPQAIAFSLLYSATIAGLVFWLFSRQPLCWLVKFLHGKASRAFAGHAPGPVYAGAVLLTAALIFFYEPARLFASDPSLFFESLAAMFGALLFKALVFLALATLAWRVAKAQVRPLFALSAAWWAVCMAVYALAVLVDYGQIDGPTLSEPEMLYLRSGPLIDAAVALGSLVLIVLPGLYHRAHYLAGALQGLVVGLCLLGCWTLFTAPAQPRLASGESLNGVPDYSERLFGFSPVQKNVVVFMLDSFTGSHVEVIFNENPELREKFQGFTWYSDTLAPGNSTIISLPSLLGGERFAPQTASEAADRTLRDRAQEAYAVVPNLMLQQGYDVSMINVELLAPDEISAYCPRFNEVMYASSADYAFINAWRMRNGLEPLNLASQSSFMSVFGLFKVAPLSLRRHIYRHGTWLQTYKIGRDSSEGAIAMLDLLTELSSTGQDSPTFKFISSMLPHDPWQLDAKCRPNTSLKRTPRPDGLTAEYLYAERCSLVFIANWLDWLRENGIFDNTKVIIVSDHSNSDTAPIGGAEGRNIRSNALLLVKDFRTGGTFTESSRLMSAGDVLALLCSDGDICGELDYYNPLLEENHRTRHHFKGGFLLRRHRANSYQGKLFRVDGPQADPASWQLEKVYE